MSLSYKVVIIQCLYSFDLRIQLFWTTLHNSGVEMILPSISWSCIMGVFRCPLLLKNFIVFYIIIKMSQMCECMCVFVLRYNILSYSICFMMQCFLQNLIEQPNDIGLQKIKNTLCFPSLFTGRKLLWDWYRYAQIQLYL